ncbi:SDR family oxidoreductase [Streptosporangium roseum]|uniref:Short-chain dehydrogenase/reductase SDR n=1 Tax=Streptosporangium roseum (strain ATCC 12428 / DSM 43021 / JCM 3005 / KCTC 9067 / NCIMB 10171 / NRRL 2505 / NI 9100) TaxID=479432 RepID=D2AS60_STRRD|nr:SDR family oxidoreductase [Streptosporangium roseum]ACZ86587.1 short-chain dehydrogenase/reductase SDR [Streptosporangium roseum DSM 43021]
MDLKLAGRVYIVGGASRGLGRATAEVLAAEGAHVVLAARTAGAAEQAAVRLPGPGRGIGLHVDLSAPETATALVTAALDTFGRLDGALVNTGGPSPGRVETITDEQWGSAFDEIFLGPVRLMRAVAGSLGPGGSILAVLSTAVRAGIPNLDISNGLRPGLAMVAKSLADQLGPRGIRVNGLLPAWIRTDRTADLGRPDLTGGVTIPENLPLRRYGEPEEFGRVAAFMLSPAASYLTGTMLAVDGGGLRAL